MIHNLAVIYPSAKIGNNVSIGPFSIIYDNVEIGDNCNIGSHCELGVKSMNDVESPLIISKNSNIRSGSVFYEGSKFGENLTTGHKITVRERVTAGNNLQLGSYTDIQGNNQFGNFVKMHSNVHIGQGCVIEDYVWLFPYALIVNDPHPPSNIELYSTIRKYTVVGARVILMPGTILGEDVLVAAGSIVSGSVENGVLVAGSPAKRVCRTSQIPLRDGSKRAAYPWRRHFHRGYPEQVVLEWMDEFK
ncbi:transferase hexapeptide (six repeat-containing protein) [Marinomonas polaris DSM 16579]|uniref:Transferase hexapeptide (Six repeat-containing protein) n=1 Tax=Marinomonas polaris DSM 16579 TaxID=1122206 RepID=A0A1M5FS93_9GAMM|nr:acyltransferase [Marinomonas polaris]SHF94410.1 transferase hexapeptide (six repeat-containing protein) [Marinomonas polaris DSM 16579]